MGDHVNNFTVSSGVISVSFKHGNVKFRTSPLFITLYSSILCSTIPQLLPSNSHLLTINLSKLSFIFHPLINTSLSAHILTQTSQTKLLSLIT